MTQSAFTNVHGEVAASPVPASRVSDVYAEVAVLDVPRSRFTDVYAEVAAPNAVALPVAGTSGQLWPRGGGQVPGGTNPPSGAAGGVLGGTYPNPSFAADMATQAELDAVAASKANTSHTHAASDVTSGVFAIGRLATGTPNGSKFVRDDGVLATPSVGGGGGLVHLGSYNAAASASIDAVTRNATGQSGAIFQSDYDEYVISLHSVIPSTAALLGFQASVAGVFATSAYEWQGVYVYSGGTGRFGNTSASRMDFRDISTTLAANAAYQGSVRIFDPLSTTLEKTMVGQLIFNISGVGILVVHWGGIYKNTAAIDGIRLIPSTGTITSGSLRVYGAAK